MSGANSVASTMTVIIASPSAAFGLRTSSLAKPSLPPRAAFAEAAAGLGAMTSMLAMSGGAHARVENDVETVHREVREQHEPGDEEQESLRERVVVAERRLLQREPDTRVAEDVLDDDEAADGGAEQRRERGQRRQDRVPRGVAGHDVRGADPLGTREQD